MFASFCMTMLGWSLVLVAWWIVRVQRRATSCPRHRRDAGAVAWILAAAALIAGLGVVAFAWLGTLGS